MILAIPVIFSDKTGFFLWGIAEEPFCLSEKNSCTSRTSLLCKCLISIAKFSSDDAIIAITEKRYAYLSLGMICVETSSERIFNFVQHNLVQKDQYLRRYQLLQILHRLKYFFSF